MLNYSMMSLCLSELKPEAVAAETVKLGMKGIDWTGTWFGNGFGVCSPEDLKKISEDAGLKVVCYIAFLQRLVYRQPDGEEELQRELDRAVLCGADKILIRTLPWTVHMHFKDFHCRTDEAPGFWRGLDGRWYQAAAIGEGDFDYPPMLRAIRESGYTGWINVEYEAKTYSQLEGVRRSVDYLRSVEPEVRPSNLSKEGI